MIRHGGTSVLVIAIAIGCGSSTPPADGGSDAQADSPIDCSKIGCAMPPPCGQPCTEVCGCCGCGVGAICSVCDSGAKD